MNLKIKAYFAFPITIMIVVCIVVLISVSFYVSRQEYDFSNTGIKSINDGKMIVAVGGDVMLDRNIRKIGNKDGYDKFFENLSPLFHSADISVVNLEGSITSFPSKTYLENGTLTKDFSFTFAPETAQSIAKSGINLVSLANNHSGNFGAIGLDETISWLSKSDVSWFGSPHNTRGSIKTIDKNGIKITFIGYHEFEAGLEDILNDIREAPGFVIVMPHWGEEYNTVPNEQIKQKAKMMIDAGADAIIASHPHVIQNHEIISEVPVFYSLGNLIFDQYFSPEVKKGNVLKMYISKNDGDKVNINKIEIYEVSIEPMNIKLSQIPVDTIFFK